MEDEEGTALGEQEKERKEEEGTVIKVNREDGEKREEGRGGKKIRREKEREEE